MPRIQTVIIDGYKFHSFPSLIFHSGKFWVNEIEVKEVYNNGSVAMVINGVKHGKKKLLQKLRKEAYKVKIEIDNCPF